MKLTFVHGHLHLGGIETLILKLARELNARGHAVRLVCGEPGDRDLEREIRRVAQVDFFPMGLVRGYSRLSSARALGLQDTDVLYAFGGVQLLTAFMLRQAAAPRARIAAGVYAPWEYFPARGSGRHDWRLIDEAFAALPDTNVLFMSEACRMDHQEALGRDFARSPVVPLPIDRPEPVARRVIDRRKIVSIGRIVHFKPYTFHMVRVIRELVARGLDVQYHVYGDGVAFPELAALVDELGLRDRVFLHGPVGYHHIPDVLSDCFLFVGVGTAALEAGALGVPTVVAYESRDPLSLGFLTDTVGSEVGEVRSRGARYPLLDKILEVFAMPESRYAALADACREHVAPFATAGIAQQYLRFFESCHDVEFPIHGSDFVRAVAGVALYKTRRALGWSDRHAERYDKRPEPARAS